MTLQEKTEIYFKTRPQGQYISARTGLKPLYVTRLNAYHTFAPFNRCSILEDTNLIIGLLLLDKTYGLIYYVNPWSGIKPPPATES